MIAEDKVIDVFCIMDEFCKNFASECGKNLLLEDKECCHRNRKGWLSHSETMTILSWAKRWRTMTRLRFDGL